MTLKIFGLLLLALCFSCGSGQQEVLTADFPASKILTFQATGLLTPQYSLLSRDEYGVFSLYEQFNELTPVGKAQLFSAGKALKNQFEKVFGTNQMRIEEVLGFVAVDETNNRPAQAMFLSGFLGELLENSGLENLNEEAMDLVDSFGLCPNCADINKMPIQDLLQNPQDFSSLSLDDFQTETLSSSLSQYDLDCNFVKFLQDDLSVYLAKEEFFREFVNSNKERIFFNSFKSSLYLNEKDTPSPSDWTNLREYFFETVYRHQKCGLSFESQPEIVSKELTIEKVFSMNEYLRAVQLEYQEILFRNEQMVKAFVSEYLKRGLEFLSQENDNRLALVIFGDSRSWFLQGILYVILGQQELFENFQEYFVSPGSSLTIEANQNGSVTIAFNQNILFQMELWDLIAKLEEFIVEDLEDFCQNAMDLL